MSDRFAAMALDVDAPARMPIMHPASNNPIRDSEGNEAYIEILSGDGEKARAFDRKRANRKLERNARSGQQAKTSAEEIEDSIVERLAHLTTGWHLVGLDGNALDVPFSEEAARELYDAGPMAYIFDQVVRFQADRANFVKASSKN